MTNERDSFTPCKVHKEHFTCSRRFFNSRFRCKFYLETENAVRTRGSVVHLMGAHYFVFYSLVVQGYCFLSCLTLIHKEVFNNELVLVPPQFQIIIQLFLPLWRPRLTIKVKQVVHLLIIDLEEGDKERELLP